MGLKKITRGFHDQLTNQVVLGMILQAEEKDAVWSAGEGCSGGQGGEKGKRWGRGKEQGRGSGGAFHSPHRPRCVGNGTHLSACVESVSTTLAALLPVMRLPPRKSEARPRLPSRTSSWMESGWMTGAAFRELSCSRLCSWGEPSLSGSPRSPPLGAFCGWLMVSGG